VKLVYKRTIITPFEVIYAKSAICAFAMFFFMLYKGVYILDLEQKYRGKVILRSVLIFLGLSLFYSSMQYIESLSYVLIF